MEYGEPYEIDYRPPGYEIVDETTGKAVKTPGEFIAMILNIEEWTRDR